ncbi:MAG: T9SS type A sorting domain-containing protein [Candidatus Kapabacteria bacterium]|nr:T9SS type A sorting domain-containing protein [Candidatus Kapabacteria bacterium]
MFGQPTPPNPIDCDCSQVNTTLPIVLTIDRNTGQNDNCFKISVSTITPVFDCINIESVVLDFSEVPECFRKNFTLYKENPALPNNFISMGNIDLSNNPPPMITLSYSGFVPQQSQDVKWKLCPTGSIDCGMFFDFKIKYKFILKRKDQNGQDYFEDCNTYKYAQAGGRDDLSNVDFTNGNFQLSPLPIVNELIINNKEIEKFNVLILDINGNILKRYFDLNIGISKFDLNTLNSGVYFVKILQNNKLIYSNKIVKE